METDLTTFYYFFHLLIESLMYSFILLLPFSYNLFNEYSISLPETALFFHNILFQPKRIDFSILNEPIHWFFYTMTMSFLILFLQLKKSSMNYFSKLKLSASLKWYNTLLIIHFFFFSPLILMIGTKHLFWVCLATHLTLLEHFLNSCFLWHLSELT